MHCRLLDFPYFRHSGHKQAFLYLLLRIIWYPFFFAFWIAFSHNKAPSVLEHTSILLTMIPMDMEESAIQGNVGNVAYLKLLRRGCSTFQYSNKNCGNPQVR